ncbi:MAG: cytidine deaminase [Oscillospiraceae bacterium]
MQDLIKKALEAQQTSYSPYSNFKVGAAILTANNKVFTGCNIENSSFSLTNCAERTAFFKAISEGEKNFKAIAIVGGKDGINSDFCVPCGACLQVMKEFCNDDFTIIIAKDINNYVIKSLKELLPLTFTL